MPRRAYILVAILATLAVFVAVPRGKPTTGHSDSPANTTERESSSNREAVDPLEKEAIATKSKIRTTNQRPTVEETTELFKNTIIDGFELDDATIQEAVVKLNQVARKNGIPAEKLVFSPGPKLAETELRVRDFRIGNAPLAVILKNLFGSTKVRYRVERGRVALYHISEAVDEAEASPENKRSDSDDPFADR